ncbi:MAG: hypothetical protein LWX56_14355 [Ignavibacteria bacterium]|nr:hypothetical protein [Ignavibacteria bacterium]
MVKHGFMLCLLLAITVWAQSNVNPDISLIGTTGISTNFTKNDPDKGKLVFTDPEVEMLVEGYLNPFAKAAAVISYEDGSFGVEELYAHVVNGLPLDMQIKAGKFLVGFGKLNTVHPHAWPFLQRPLFHQIYFSPDGFNDIGANFSFILPFESFYSGIDIGVFRGDALTHSISAEDTYEAAKQRRGNNPIGVARWNGFFTLSDESNFELGVSIAGGLLDKQAVSVTGDTSLPSVIKALNFCYTGLDFKYKYKPDAYTSLVLQGEAILNNRDVVRSYSDGVNTIQNLDHISTTGAFMSIDYRFDKQFSVGCKYDFTYGLIGDTPGNTTLGNDSKNKTMGYEGWIGYYPVEETLALRLGFQSLQFSVADGPNPDPRNTVQLQMIFSLGPHKAHPF